MAASEKAKLALVTSILLLATFSFSIFRVHAGPVMIDTKGRCAAAGGVATCSLTVTTTNDNDIFLIGAYGDTGGNGISTITDSAGLQYYPRSSPIQQASIWVVEEWYAKQSRAVTSDSITLTMNGSPSSMWGFTFAAVSGAYYLAPFDDVYTPVTGSGTICPNGGFPTLSLPVVHGQEFVIAFFGANGVATTTADPGFTFIGPAFDNFDGEYQFYSSAPGNVQFSFGNTICLGSETWGIVVDALCMGLSCLQGGKAPTSNPANLQSTTVGGYSVPPQLADQGVLSLMGIISGIILLSAVPIERKKKRKDSFI